MLADKSNFSLSSSSKPLLGEGLKVIKVLGTMKCQNLLRYINENFDKFSFYVNNTLYLYCIDEEYEEQYYIGELEKPIYGDFIVMIVPPSLGTIYYDTDYYGNIVYYYSNIVYSNANDLDSITMEKEYYGIRCLISI
jgi:hypothetical protein